MIPLELHIHNPILNHPLPLQSQIHSSTSGKFISIQALFKSDHIPPNHPYMQYTKRKRKNASHWPASKAPPTQNLELKNPTPPRIEKENSCLLMSNRMCCGRRWKLENARGCEDARCENWKIPGVLKRLCLSKQYRERHTNVIVLKAKESSPSG